MPSNIKQNRTKHLRKRVGRSSFKKNRSQKSFLSELKRGSTMKGGMFTGNFETHLGELSPSAYIPFNISTGTTADPIAPMNQHDSRLDMQVPTTPNLMKGGKRSRKNKTKKSPRAMKGGNWFGSVPVFREIASNHDYALGTLATDRHTNQPTVVNSQPISNPANLFESRYLI